MKDNLVVYDIDIHPGTPLRPEEALPEIPLIPRGSVVIVQGRAPIWFYGYAFHKLHGSSAAAIAVYDPKVGAVIVASHSPEYKTGQVIDWDPDKGTNK